MLCIIQIFVNSIETKIDFKIQYQFRIKNVMSVLKILQFLCGIKCFHTFLPQFLPLAAEEHGGRMRPLALPMQEPDTQFFLDRPC